jgi:hypothetical protein
MTYPLAQSHHSDTEGNLVVDHHYADNTMHYPSGFIMSTVLDLANFAIMHLSDGSFEGQQILTPTSVAEMHTPHIRFRSLNDDGYGLTFSSFNYKGVRRVGHGGRISSFASQLELVPETGSAVIMLANNAEQWSPHENAITRLILDELLDLPAETELPTFIEPNRSLWDRLVGIYTGVISGAGEVAREGDDLMLIWQGKPLPLRAVAPDLYVAQPPEGEPLPVSFMLDGDVPAEFMSVLVASGYSLALKRLDVETDFQPDTRDLAQYVGVYEAGFGSLTVRLNDDALIVTSPLFQNAEFSARPIGLHRFLLPAGLLTFDPPKGVWLGAALYFERLPEPA